MHFHFLKHTGCLLLVLSLCGLNACQASGETDLPVVEHVELDKYIGKWYEIASYPQKFQKDCFRSQAEYSISEKGYIHVKNSCNKGELNGPLKVVTGKAFIDDETTNAKLKVQFFWPFKGKYWIIDLAGDYSYAVVGHPNREYLWILSRTPQMDPSTLEKIKAKIQQLGFDPGHLKMTPQ